MRAHDGFLGLNIEGGNRLLQTVKYPANRVVVNEDSAEYNARGYNVFRKFVIDFDPHIIPLNDVLVVDSDDNLLAVGRAMLSGIEMATYRGGMVVSVNHHTRER
jgi:uncharacterized domain 2